PDGALTIVLINKTLEDLTSHFSLTSFAQAGSARMYRYSSTDLAHILRGADLPLTGGNVSLSLPASSITLLVAYSQLPGDINADGVVNSADLSMFISVLLGTDNDPAHRARSDLNADGLADGADIQGFIAAIMP